MLLRDFAAGGELEDCFVAHTIFTNLHFWALWYFDTFDVKWLYCGLNCLHVWALWYFGEYDALLCQLPLPFLNNSLLTSPSFNVPLLRGLSQPSTSRDVPTPTPALIPNHLQLNSNSSTTPSPDHEEGKDNRAPTGPVVSYAFSPSIH